MIHLSVGIDRGPVPVGDPFGAAESDVEISAQTDALALAGLRQLPEQVEIQMRMPRAQFGVVIGHPHVAAGVKSHIIHAAFDKPVGQFFRIEILPHIRMLRTGVEIVKQGIFDLVHDASYSRMKVLNLDESWPPVNPSVKATQRSDFITPDRFRSKKTGHMAKALPLTGFPIRVSVHGISR